MAERIDRWMADNGDKFEGESAERRAKQCDLAEACQALYQATLHYPTPLVELDELMKLRSKLDALLECITSKINDGLDRKASS